MGSWRLGLNAIRQPSWNKIWICQISCLLPYFILFLHVRLDNGHQVTIVTIDEIRSVDVLKLVAVVKQGIETKLSQGQERRGLDLKDFKNLEWVHVYWRIFVYNIFHHWHKRYSFWWSCKNISSEYWKSTTILPVPAILNLMYWMIFLRRGFKDSKFYREFLPLQFLKTNSSSNIYPKSQNIHYLLSFTS